MNVAEPSLALRAFDRDVATYVTHPVLATELSPRPFLHPVRTLGGTAVTDVLPEDHRWHLGAGLAVQDVAGTNLWGGRTYVRGQGYTWLPDHGRIEHVEWLSRADDRLVERLDWNDAAGRTLLHERRTIQAQEIAVPEAAWVLDFGYALTNVTDQEVPLGSPATNGRPDGAGYGGFFWRATARETPTVFTPDGEGEQLANGSAAPWLAFTAESAQGGWYTLVFTGLADDDRWFVRAAGYPGVCVALAFEKPLPIAPEQTLTRRHRVLIADGARNADEVAAMLARMPNG